MTGVVVSPSSTTSRVEVGWSPTRLVMQMVVGLTAASLVGAHEFANRWAPKRVHTELAWLVGGWLRWDSWWYVNIAADGYTYRPHHMSSVAFFPIYPLIVRAVAAVVPIGDALAAVAVTIGSGFVALHLLYRWCRARTTMGVARAAVVSIALYPFAWFLFGAGYSDALFLALVLGAFVLLDTDHLLAAVLVGAIATATRPTGITLVVGLLAVALDRRGRLGRGPRLAVRARDLAVVGSIAGLVAWCVWLWLRFGNPFVFIETEGAPGWNQPPGPRTWFKLRLFHYLGHVHLVEAVAVLIQIAAIPFFLWAVPHVARRFGRGYAIYTLAVVIFPTVSTADFLGVGRYLLPAFPVFALAAEKLHERRNLERTARVMAAALLFTGTTLYSAGYLIA